MNSSGMKRGLASAAIAALAVAGLPFIAGSASATSLTEQNSTADSTTLYTPESNTAASVKNDGVNSTVHLLASGGSNVVQVHFEYSSDGGTTWNDIATVSRSNGAFSTEWTPPTSTYNLPQQVRATGLTGVGTPTPGGASTATVVTPTSAAEAIDVSNPAGSSLGVFVQPYASATGARPAAMTESLAQGKATTSDVAANPATTFYSAYNSTHNPEDVAEPTTAGMTSRKVQGPVDLTGYVWDTTAPIVDEAVIKADVSTGPVRSTDAEVVNVYKQKISDVTAVASPNPTQGSSNSTVTVTVLDQNGKPVVGAEVFRDDNGDNAGDSAPKYTNSNGQATYSLPGSPAPGTTYAFFVNTNDDPTYNSAVDYKRTVTITNYTPAATTITTNSHDGAAFDRDECSTGDFTATVKDQNGNGMAGLPLNATWTENQFDGTPATPTTSAATVTDNGDGTYTISCPVVDANGGTYTLNVWQEKDGNPGESAGDFKAAPLNVKSGESKLVWADGSKAQAPAGTTATFKGTIELADGTPLPNRNVSIVWTKSTDNNGSAPGGQPGNAVVAAQSAQPAGTTRVDDSNAKAVSDANGNFAVAISDQANLPAGSDQDELGGQLVANSANTPAYGTNNDNTSAPLTVDFLAHPGVDQNNTQANIDTWGMCSASSPGTDSGGSSVTPGPGRPGQVFFTVENVDGTPLTDLPVTVTTDHGFFTTHDDPDGGDAYDYCNQLKPVPAAAEGADYGHWEKLGTSFNTKTDDSGLAFANIAIERDAGFDDDGLVTADVTITVGGKTFHQPLTFDSSDPLNPGTLTINLANDQDSTILPDARTSNTVSGESQRVFWDVKATDEFGNRVGGETVTINDGTSPANSPTSVTSNFEGDSSFETTSDKATDQTLHGSWAADTWTWTDGDTVAPGFQEETAGGDDSLKHDTKTLTADSQTIHWYDLDLANSVFKLTHTGTDPFPVGSVVQETYKAVDQKGQGIDGLLVNFFRTGPDNNHSGQQDGYGFTNEQGEAYYAFQGETPGTATVSASAFDEYNQNCGFFVCDTPVGTHLLPGSQATDQVVFSNQAGPVAISVLLSGHNNGAKADRLKADAPANAAGATVKLQKQTASGWKTISTKTANAYGNAKFKVADKNGNRFTSYRTKYGKTGATKAATSNTKRVR